MDSTFSALLFSSLLDSRHMFVRMQGNKHLMYFPEKHEIMCHDVTILGKYVTALRHIRSGIVLWLWCVLADADFVLLCSSARPRVKDQA